MNDASHDAWESFGHEMASVSLRLGAMSLHKRQHVVAKVPGQRVSAVLFPASASHVTPAWLLAEESLGVVDGEMQEVLRLSNGNNRKSYYTDHLKRIDSERTYGA